MEPPVIVSGGKRLITSQYFSAGKAGVTAKTSMVALVLVLVLVLPLIATQLTLGSWIAGSKLYIDGREVDKGGKRQAELLAKKQRGKRGGEIAGHLQHFMYTPNSPRKRHLNKVMHTPAHTLTPTPTRRMGVYHCSIYTLE